MYIKYLKLLEKIERRSITLVLEHPNWIKLTQPNKSY